MTAIAARPVPAHPQPKQDKPDLFDRIGDAVGAGARTVAGKAVDRATVFNPVIGATRAIVDPEGTKQSFKNVGKDAFDVLSITNPAVGAARLGAAVARTPEGKAALENGAKAVKAGVAAGAKGAVDAATLTNPAFFVGRAIVDPEGTKETVTRTVKTVEKAMDNPFNSYGLAKRAVKFAAQHPEAMEKGAKVGFDVLTLTNPSLLIGRGLYEAFKQQD